MTENVIVEFEGRLIEFSKSEQWRKKTEKKKKSLGQEQKS